MSLWCLDSRRGQPPSLGVFVMLFFIPFSKSKNGIGTLNTCRWAQPSFLVGVWS